MKTLLTVDDVTIQSQVNWNTMQTAVVSDLNNKIVSQLSDEALHNICVTLFGTDDVSLVKDTCRMLMEDREMQEKVIAMRARKRIAA